MHITWHGDLIRKLNKHRASLIVFDVFFEENRNSQENTLFAPALREANKVILFQSMNKAPINNEALRAKPTGYIEALISPIPVLRAEGLWMKFNDRVSSTCNRETR